MPSWFFPNTAPSAAPQTTTSEAANGLDPYGIKILHDPPGSVVDIVFVHGLTGDRERTWRAKDAADCWPKTLLPEVIPEARILTFGYDAYVANWKEWQGKVSRNRIRDHAGNLLHAIADDCRERAIIFVCHSLGGLVCKDALVVARERKKDTQFQKILHNTRGIIFLGTPHLGSATAVWAEGLAKVVGVVKNTNRRTLRDLKQGSDELIRIQESFQNLVDSRSVDGLAPIEVLCCFEELPTPGVGQIVTQQSATLVGSSLPIGIHRNHSEITKFGSKDDPGFKAVTGGLKRLIERVNFNTSDLHPMQSVPMSSPSRTPTSSSGSSSSNESSFFKIPSGDDYIVSDKIVKLPFSFPKTLNSNHKYFEGRELELDKLRKTLLPTSQSSECGKDAPSAGGNLRSFAITGLGGCGKTQLANRFIADNRQNETEASRYDAVFFLTADSASRLSDQYTKLAIRLGLASKSDRESPEHCREVLKSWLAEPIRGAPHEASAAKPLKWLMVFDNVENADDLTHFWPYSNSGCGAVLITSRSTIFHYGGITPGITGSLALDSLPTQDAASLLKHLAEYNANSDTAAADDAAALVLAEKLGGLPLALNQIGAIMHQQRLSLSRFANTYPKRSDLYELFPQIPALQSYSHSLATVWALKELPVGAFAILSLISVLDPVAVDDTLLRPSTSTATERPLIADYPVDSASYYRDVSVLYGSSMIDANRDDGRHSVHRLVQDVTRAQMRVRGLDHLEHAFKDGIRRVSEQWPFINRNYATGTFGNTDQWPQRQLMLPHIIYLQGVYAEIMQMRNSQQNHSASSISQAGRDLAELLLEAAQFRLQCDLSHEALPLVKEAKVIYQSDAGSWTQEELGKLYRAQVALAMHDRDADAAIRYAKLVLDLEEKRHAEELGGRGTAILPVAYNDMANALALRREWDQALDALDMSRKIREALPGFTKDKLFSPFYHRGLVLHHQGKYHEASKVLEEAISDRTAALGTAKEVSDIRSAGLCFALGNVKYAQGDFSASFELHKKAVDRCSASAGGATRRSTLNCKYQLARHYARLQDWKQVHNDTGKILSNYVNLPQRYFEIARVAFLYSQSCRHLGKAEEATDWLQKTVEMYNHLRPSDRLKTVEDLTEEDVRALVVYDFI